MAIRFTVRITDKDIEYLDSVIATHTTRKNMAGAVRHGESGSYRFKRLKELGLIQLSRIEGATKLYYVPSSKGQELLSDLLTAKLALSKGEGQS